MKKRYLVGAFLLVAFFLFNTLLVTGCDADFQMSITNKSQEELYITVQINPPREHYDLGPLAPGKTVQKTFPFL